MSDRLARAESAARDLLSGDERSRAVALRELKLAYVECDENGCVTHPDVAALVAPFVLQGLDSPDLDVRLSAIDAIVLLASDGARFLERVFPLLDDPEQAIRLAAMDVFTEFGPAARPAAPRLLELLEGAASAEERASAVDALANMNLVGSHVERVLEHLVDDEPIVQAAVAGAVALCLGSDDAATRDAVSGALRRLRERAVK